MELKEKKTFPLPSLLLVSSLKISLGIFLMLCLMLLIITHHSFYHENRALGSGTFLVLAVFVGVLDGELSLRRCWKTKKPKLSFCFFRGGSGINCVDPEGEPAKKHQRPCRALVCFCFLALTKVGTLLKMGLTPLIPTRGNLRRTPMPLYIVY
jgi:hypothetical protein